MDKSIFEDKQTEPAPAQLKVALKGSYNLWEDIRTYTLLKYPGGIEEWNYSGEKYGWSFRIKDKKRALVYLLPRDGFFKVAFVFGKKATDSVLASDISYEIRKELETARVYAEGRGIRIEVRDESLADDLKKLVDCKIAF
ncbi:MAG: DUF3788 domain-containing protein [Bacteroidetes bacterium]|nr:DUF3788 domain-containing protein [Bacteroidota bacterium]